MHSRRLVFCAILSVSLAACQPPPVAQSFDPPSYAQEEPIWIDAASITVVPEYQPPRKEPYTEHMFPLSPMEAVKDWTKRRLKPSGTGGILQVQILDAPVVEARVNPHEDPDFHYEYHAILDVEFALFPPGSSLPSHVTGLKVRHKRKAPESLSLAEREALFHKITMAVMEEFDHSATILLERGMAAYPAPGQDVVPYAPPPTPNAPSSSPASMNNDGWTAL